MSDSRLVDYLRHVSESAELACRYIEGMDKQEFLADTRTQQAVIMNIVIMGEG